MSSILKSSALIKSIKTRGFIPESQKTFEPQDFLDIATEKINISLMKEIVTARGDYLVYFTDIPFVEGVSAYSIPDRAHGDKLRDIAIVDADGNVKREMTQISLEELSDYRYDSQYTGGTDAFYAQNNEIILINKNYINSDKIRMYFYMRPNKLVVESRAVTITSISSSVEIDSIAPKAGTISGISLTGVITSASHGLTTGSKIILTGTDSAPAVDGTYTVTIIDANSFSIPTTVTTIGTSGSWTLAADVLVVPSANLPKHFITSILYDIVSCKSPNNIKLYNIKANSINNTSKSISLRVADVGTKISMGDYVTQAEETIVPNVPTEYHPVIAQMVAVHCMESMADEVQKKSAMVTLEQMKDDVLSIVQNRVEGAPKKIRNRNGTLASATNRNFRRRG